MLKKIFVCLFLQFLPVYQHCLYLNRPRFKSIMMSLKLEDYCISLRILFVRFLLVCCGSKEVGNTALKA